MYIVLEPKPQKVTIGRNIRFIREARGLSQAGLAMELGICQQTLSRIERSVSVDSNRLKAVAKALDVSPAFVLNCEDLLTEFLKGPDQVNKGAFGKETLPQAMDQLIELYERLIQVEREKVAHLERLLERNALREFPRPYSIMRIA